MEIRLLDSNLKIFGDPIDDYSSLSYSDKWEDYGSFTAVMSNDHYTDVAAASYVYFDSRTFEIETLSSTELLTISGRALSSMLDKIAIYEIERVQGRLEECVRYLIAKYAMSGAQSIPKLELETDNDFKRAMDVTTERGSLGSFLRTALNQRGFSFDLEYDVATDKIIFHLLRSTDRSQDQSTNAAVMFSTDAGNIEKIEYKRTTQDYRNFAYVCDEDATAPQTVEVDLSNGEPIRAMYVSGKSAGADTSAAPNLYVMVGQYSSGVGFIASSIDGITFTSRVTSGYGAFWAVDYQNGMFIVCGDGGAILTSTDAITWTQQTSGVSVALEGAMYDSGLYVVTGNSGKILVSYDGLEYEDVASGSTTARIEAPTKTASGYTAVAAAINTFASFYSPNGYDWSATRYVTQDASSASATGVALLNQNVFACGAYVLGGVQYPTIAKSTDGGITWTIEKISSLSDHSFLDIASGNELLVAVGQPNLIAWSDDGGVTWTNCTPSGGTPNYITICFNETDKTFHAYSYTGKYHAYSSDGKSWTLSTFTGSPYTVDAVAYGTSSHSGNLYQIGVDALQATRSADVIDGQVLPDVQPIYGTDYVVGDIADIKDDMHGILASKRIVEVQHIREPNQIITIPKFGVDFLNLRQFITKEIKNG